MHLTQRNWNSVSQDLMFSDPYNYAVIDNFLKARSLKVIRQKLINHPGWHRKNWFTPCLNNDNPDIPEVNEIVENLKILCPDIFKKHEYVECWSLMYLNNTAAGIHADEVDLTLNIWLTPDVYNLNKYASGLTFYDVKYGFSQSSEICLHKDYYTSSEAFVRQNTKGQRVSVSYKCNRAVLFDGQTFHKTDDLNFVNLGIDSYRINLSLGFNAHH